MTLSGKLDYDNYALDSQGAPDDSGISFRWTGKFVSSKRIHLVLKGKVTKARTDVSDCAGVHFTERRTTCAPSASDTRPDWTTSKTAVAYLWVLTSARR